MLSANRTDCFQMNRCRFLVSYIFLFIHVRTYLFHTIDPLKARVWLALCLIRFEQPGLPQSLERAKKGKDGCIFSYWVKSTYDSLKNELLLRTKRSLFLHTNKFRIGKGKLE